MLLHTDYIEPVELTGYVRAFLADQDRNRQDLDRFLPNRVIDDLQYRFTAGGEGLDEAAKFRTYDAESGIGSRPGVTRVTGELPPISRKIRLSEYDRLRQRNADDAIVDGLYSDAERMTRAVAARMELARGDALVTGKVTINENGVVATVDFGRAAGHTVSAGTAWSDHTNATVLADLIAWFDTYVATNGVNPETLLTSTTVARHMQQNAEIINAISGSASGRSRITMTELNELLESESLPRISLNNAQVKVDGSATRVVASDKVLLLPAPGDPDDPDSTDLGTSLWGTTAEALQPEYGIEEGDLPGIVAGVYSTDDPVALWTKAAALGLPVLANPDLSFAADVLA